VVAEYKKNTLLELM